MPGKLILQFAQVVLAQGDILREIECAAPRRLMAGMRVVSKTVEAATLDFCAKSCKCVKYSC